MKNTKKWSTTTFLMNQHRICGGYAIFGHRQLKDWRCIPVYIYSMPSSVLTLVALPSRSQTGCLYEVAWSAAEIQNKGGTTLNPSGYLQDIIWLLDTAIAWRMGCLKAHVLIVPISRKCFQYLSALIFCYECVWNENRPFVRGKWVLEHPIL